MTTSPIASPPFAYGVARVCPLSYSGGGGDRRHALVRRLLRRAAARHLSPTAGRAYRAGEWAALVAAGQAWAAAQLARV